MTNCKWVGIGITITEGPLHTASIEADKFLSTLYQSRKRFDHYEPHINLFDFDAPEDTHKAIQTRINKIALETLPIDIKAIEFDYFYFGLFFVKMVNSSQVLQLHEKIVRSLFQFKGNCINGDYMDPIRNLNLIETGYRDKYGNPYIFENFHPHITVGHIDPTRYDLESAKKELNLKINVADMHYEVKTIHYAQNTEKGIVRIKYPKTAQS